jgi:hypothetical protein
MTTLSRDGYSLVVGFGINTQRQLKSLLPTAVLDRIYEGGGALLRESQSAAALRILATIRNPAWQQYVEPQRIDWDGMLNRWARRELQDSDSVRVRVEAAASLGHFSGARPDLLYVARALDPENLLAVIDAIRIVAEGGLES